MKVIYNNIIPFPGFKAINLFGILFIRKGCIMRNTDINHEAIHTEQIKELFYIGFYICYLIEWIFRLFQYSFTHQAYRNISFEKECFENQYNLDYIKNRKHYSFIKYI